MCAFVTNGRPPIYVSTRCAPYKRAENDLLEAMKLAAILRHEEAHLEGADERTARKVEAATMRDLVRRASREHMRKGMLYAAALEQER